MTRVRHKTRYPGIYYRLVDEEKPEGDRRYIVWYSDSNGKAHTVTLPVEASLEDARLRQADLSTRKSKGETLIRTKLTVSELVDIWADTLSDKTREGYAYPIGVLKQRIGDRKARDLTTSDVARLIRELKGEGKKTWTVKKIITPLRASYRLAVRDGVVATNPCQNFLPHERPRGDQRQMRCLSSQEISALLGSCGSSRWRALFSLLVFGGLRVSEALGLTWDDITEDTVIIRRGKTEAAAREVMLIPSVRKLLMEEKLKQPAGHEFVFSTQSGAPLGRRDALRALRLFTTRAGIPSFTLHELRHTFASILIAQGELPTMVAKQMGHTDPGLTMKVYAHLWEAQESTDKAREKLQAAMGGMI
jgi:integrase